MCMRKVAVKSVRALCLLTTMSGLVACESVTTRATDERLTNLLSDGLDEAAAERAAKRLSATLERDNATGALADRYASDPAFTGTATLASLLSSALERNTRIGTAAQRINQADAERLNAIFGYLPQVNITVSNDQINQKVIETDNAVFALGQARYPVTTLTARIDQPILDLSRIFGIQHATNARSISEVEYIRTVRDVAYEVFDAYLVANQARARSKSLRQRMALLGRQIGAQTALNESGLGDVIEVSSLRAERNTMASEEALEASRYIDTLGDLAGLTGMSVSQIETLRFPQGIARSENRLSAAKAVAIGLEQNPLIMSAALSVVGAELDRRRALATDFAPVLAAYAMLERQDRGDSRFGGGSVTEDTTVGVRLTIPIFNGRGRGYDTLPATVGVRREALDYHARRREVETEIRAAHARLSELTRAMGQAGNAAREAARAVGSERDRLATGQSAELAVAARELRLSTARERAAFYQIEYIRSWARLQYLMGADLTQQGF